MLVLLPPVRGGGSPCTKLAKTQTYDKGISRNIGLFGNGHRNGGASYAKFTTSVRHFFIPTLLRFCPALLAQHPAQELSGV